MFDDELAHLAHEFGDARTSAKLVGQDLQLVRFFIPEKTRWPYLAAQTTGLGEVLTDAVRAVARENSRLAGVIDVKDLNETAAGQRMVDDGRLAALVQVLNNPDHRLGGVNVRLGGWLCAQYHENGTRYWICPEVCPTT